MTGEAAPEERFGPYLVYERLGVGGMATVHRALEHAEDGSERIVALKRLLPHLAEDSSFIKSFVREAKLASILNHLNIVQIYELGRVGTEYFISMEYIDGRDLRRLLRHARKVTGPPPVYVTVGLMLQLCDALDYAHNRVDEDGHPLGLVHRDISPSNLIVTSAGQLKIIDFGIAKAQSSQLRTQTGRVKGKLAYMAPEAVSGSRDLDARSDIWAAGVILHELCTARPLFASKNEYQTLLKVQRGDIVQPSTFNQACPPELDAIVSRALARDPDHRYASAAELREELLRLKRQYALQTSIKDVAGWVDWAFGLEPPGGFSGDTSGVLSMNTSRIHGKTPRPPRDQEEDEAVEVVWGSGNVESEDGPVVLEEVPDVSSKHRAKRDTEDESLQEDDIPTPLPSHGTLPSVYGARNTPELLVVPQPDPRLFGAEAALARGTDPPASRPVVPMPARSKVPTLQPVMPRTATGPQLPKRADSPSSPPLGDPRPRRPTAPGVDAPQVSARIAALRERDGIGGDTPPLDMPTVLDRAPSMGDVTTTPAGTPLSAAELFGNDAADVLASVTAQVESMATHASMPQFQDEPTTSPEIKPKAASPSVPVVRFSKSHSVPPANVSANDTSGVLDPVRPAMTKPGVGLLSTPPTTVRVPAPPSRPPTNAPVDIIAPRRSRTPVLFIIAGVLLAGGTATLVALSMSGDDAAKTDSVSAATPPGPSAEPAAAPLVQPSPAKAVGKVKFDLEPTDAEIKIEGQSAHRGSPWSTELAVGSYQIEIHRAGYKSWVTSIELSENETASLRVVLEPITSAIAGDASLTITTTPAGLDVLIDGTLLAQKTPIRTTLKVGHHQIAVRQNGVEVWQQNLDAEAASDYEFNPSFTDDKKRERAQRPTTPRPIKKAPRPAPPPPSDAPGSGSAAPAPAAPPPSTGSGSAAVQVPDEPAPAATPATPASAPSVVPPAPRRDMTTLPP